MDAGNLDFPSEETAPGESELDRFRFREFNAVGPGLPGQADIFRRQRKTGQKGQADRTIEP